MNRPEKSISIMGELRRLGFDISLDDFGMGYSSLSMLKKLPISSIKIERLFVKSMPQERDDCAIVRAILALDRNMRIRVIAEGVETDAQPSFLRQFGRLVQGYLLGRPMPVEQLIAVAHTAGAPRPSPQAIAAVADMLAYINRPYTVYIRIFVYERSGVIVASSGSGSCLNNAQGEHGACAEVDAVTLAQVLALRAEQDYYVSPFAPSPLYGQPEHLCVSRGDPRSRQRGAGDRRHRDGVRCRCRVFRDVARRSGWQAGPAGLLCRAQRDDHRQP